MAFGLFQTRAIPRWQSLTLAVGSFLFASAAVIDVLGAFSAVLLFVGMAPTGWKSLVNDPK